MKLVVTGRELLLVAICVVAISAVLVIDEGRVRRAKDLALSNCAAVNEVAYAQAQQCNKCVDMARRYRGLQRWYVRESGFGR